MHALLLFQQSVNQSTSITNYWSPHHSGLQFFRKDYTDFAKVCFKNFGKKVKNWLTFNEPETFCSVSYGTGVLAPGRCSPGLSCACAVPTGNSLTEPYIVAHNLLRAHAKAVDLYNKYHKVHMYKQIKDSLLHTHSSKLIYTPSVPNYKSLWFFWFIYFAMFLDMLLYLDA